MYAEEGKKVPPSKERPSPSENLIWLCFHLDHYFVMWYLGFLKAHAVDDDFGDRYDVEKYYDGDGDAG